MRNTENGSASGPVDDGATARRDVPHAGDGPAALRRDDSPAARSAVAPLDDTLLARLRTLPTAALSDALDRIGVEGALHGLAPLANEFRAVGPAFTVRYVSTDGVPGTVGDFLDDVPPGAVIVIDNAGRIDVTVWGGIMTEVAAARGIAGTVVNGVCRDVSASLTQSYPLFSRGRFMRTGKDRVRLAAVGGPVTVSGVEIRPGDLVTADADGVLVIPAAEAERVTGIAERIEQAESDIVTAAHAGATLREARERFGYHRLQTRSEA